MKTWPIIAAELEFNVSDSTVERVFHERGYQRCKVIYKPYFSDFIKANRYDWISERRFWIINVRNINDWSNVYFTDETLMLLGI